MKYIIYISIYLTIGGIIYFNACGTNEISPGSTTTNCGTGYTNIYPTVGYFYASDHTNAYVENGFRVFQYSAIPLSTIDNICTFVEPEATGLSHWKYLSTDTLRSISSKLVVNIGGGSANYINNGNVGSTNCGTDICNEWNGFIRVGLRGLYGNGPGEILDFRIEIRFWSRGDETVDAGILHERDFHCSMQLNYNQYVSSDAGTGWEINTAPKNITDNFLQNVIKGKYLIGAQFDKPKGIPVFVLN